MGRERGGDRVTPLWARGRDGGLSAKGWYSTKSARAGIIAHRLDELQRRLIEAEGFAMHDDPMAMIAKNVVAAGGATFSACCGRTLTDPVSVETGIGPECGTEFHEAFNRIWAAARTLRP